MARKRGFIIAAISMFSVLPVAQAQIYKVVLSGANEIPVVASNGTGSAVITLNAATHEMHVAVSFSGLVAGTTASHVHCCVVQPANAGVATTSPTFIGTPLGVTSGSWDRVYDMSQAGSWNAPFLTASGNTPAGAEAAFIAGVAAGQSYLNVHSTTFTGGEIRGFLVLNRFAANSALSTGGRNAAVALDALGAGTGTLNTVLVSMAALSAAPQAVALEMLTPTPSRGVHTIVSEGLDTAFDRISDRLGGLRQAAATQGSASPAGAANGFWVMGSGADSRQGARDGYAGYRNSGWGAALGFDHGLAPGRYVGASLNYTRSSLRFRDQSAGDTARVKSTQLALYASQDVGAGFLDAMASYGQQRYDGARNTGVGTAASNNDGTTWAVRAGGGLRAALSSSAAVTPQLRIDYDNIRQDAYVESGGGPLALSVQAKSAKRVRASLGAQFDLGAGTVRPYLRGFWHHNFSNSGLDAASSFVTGGAAFTAPGQKPEREAYSVGAGLNIHASGSFAGALTYDGTFSGSYQSHFYEAKAFWMF